MRLFPTRASSLLAICTIALLAGLPSAAAQGIEPPKTLTTTTVAITHTTTTTTPVQTTATVPPITTIAPITTTIITTTLAPTLTLPPTTAAPPTTAQPTTTTTAPAPPANTTIPCMSSELCPANQLCALQSTSAVTGVCQVMEQFQKLCPSSPVINCVSSKDCTDPGFSYCAVDTNGNKICSGLGRPGTASQCDPNNPNNNNGSSGTGSSSVTTTLKYAGIAVGSIAFLAIIFALVRWRRNKSRSKMPDFAEIDYGMTNRRSEPRSSVGAAAAAAGAGEQSYPFSSRPHAKNQTVAAAQDDYYDEQYYADGYAQNAHPAAGMAGGAVKQGQAYYDGSYDNYNQQAYNSGYAQQGYDQQGYNQQGYDQQAYAQQGYDQHAYDQQYYNGYDQHGNYVGNGYYDANQAGGYEGYTKEEGYPVATSAAPVVPAEAVVRSGSRQRFGGAAPAAAAGDYAVDNYGAEPSELDFGGRGNGRKQ